jgi:hypothetical protein
VAAGVPEGPDLVGPAAHHEDRLVADLVEDRVPDLGDLLDSARHLPDAAPEPLLLQLVEGTTRVAGDVDVLVAEPPRVLVPEHVGARLPVGADDLLVAAPR